MDVSLEKLPPHDKEAEMSVLGACLRSEEAYFKASELVCAEDFYRTDHKKIFNAIVSLYEREKQLDVLSLNDELKKMGESERVGGLDYLSLIEDFVPTSQTVTYHCEILKRLSAHRQVINISEELKKMGYEATRSKGELLGKVQELAFSLNIGERQAIPSFSEVMSKTINHVREIIEKEDSVAGVPSGFKNLDDKTAGFQKSDLIILAARPSMGKTTLAFDIVDYVARVEEIPVAVFSLEMSDVQLGLRRLSAEAGVNLQSIRTGNYKSGESKRVLEAATKIAHLPIWIDERSGLNPLEIASKARRLKVEEDIGLIVIDYLQLMSGTRNSNNKNEEISEITRSLKNLAKELNVPIIALSQLSRKVDERTDKRPVLSDLRDSGSIEQDADVVLFLYREYQYNDKVDPGEAELNIGKQRNGPLGRCYLTFKPKYVKFENPEITTRKELNEHNSDERRLGYAKAKK